MIWKENSQFDYIRLDRWKDSSKIGREQMINDRQTDEQTNRLMDREIDERKQASKRNKLLTDLLH